MNEKTPKAPGADSIRDAVHRLYETPARLRGETRLQWIPSRRVYVGSAYDCEEDEVPFLLDLEAGVLAQGGNSIEFSFCGGCGAIVDPADPRGFCRRCGYPEGSAMLARGWRPPVPESKPLPGVELADGTRFEVGAVVYHADSEDELANRALVVDVLRDGRLTLLAPGAEGVGTELVRGVSAVGDLRLSAGDVRDDVADEAENEYGVVPGVVPFNGLVRDGLAPNANGTDEERRWARELDRQRKDAEAR